MGLLARLFGRTAKDTGGSTTSASPAAWFVDWVRGTVESLTGIHVTPKSALGLPAVWACARVKSEDVGKLPCILYRQLPGGGKERATDHPYYRLIRYQPNPLQTAMDFKQFMQMQLDLRGNALALKEYDDRARVVALWPIAWEHVKLLRSADNRQVFYKVTLPGVAPVDPYLAEDVVHLKGMSLDGLVGLSPIAFHRETIGLALAAERYGAAFFGNNAQPQGGIEVPATIGSEAAKTLRDSFEERHRGIDNAHKIAVFDGGMKWVQTGLSNDDAQYIEVRGLQDKQVWRIYRMPPHKVGDLEKATNNNIEQQALEYVTDCLLSELVRWEQTLWRDLLTTEEQKTYFFEFLVDALLRGDFKSRMEGYAIGRNWGLFSADDCRDKENMNPLPDGKGKIYLQPLNMIEAGTTPPINPSSAKDMIAHLEMFAARAALPAPSRQSLS